VIVPAQYWGWRANGVRGAHRQHHTPGSDAGGSSIITHHHPSGSHIACPGRDRLALGALNRKNFPPRPMGRRSRSC